MNAYWLLLWTKGAIVQRVPSDLLNVLLCSYMLDKRSLCAADLCSTRPCVELCGVESCAPPPSKPLSPPCPSKFRLILLAASQKNRPGWSTSKRLRAAKSMSIECRTMCMKIAIYFPTKIIFLWKRSQISCPLSIDYYYLFRLITKIAN